ncbi:MAG TPA: zf-HC2 domain-containing protein [Oscillatoriaceae cyanobacterium M7585_C2015_266]|nr:zf-HC2 domain-containing protein [Oscillatoriaceae cyanobacterium M7585_C2015_266]
MTNVVTLQRDRFELLSAYLDGEVGAAERKQVEEWLQNDTVVQGLYKRLLNLRSGMQNMPVPATEQSVEKTVEQVLTRVERQPKLRLILGGVAAAAALALAAISSLLTSEPSFSPQMATTPQPKATPEKLMIAINNPVVEIPKPVQPSQERIIMSRALFIE